MPQCVVTLSLDPKALLAAGAERIVEPKLERLAEAGLSRVIEYLDVYRALSSEAYLGLAHSNALSNAFKLTGRLRKIGDVWEAVNKDFYDLAEEVEQFAASLLNYIVNTYEVSRVLHLVYFYMFDIADDRFS